ncbi:tryptophan 2,3-dioxygenase [Pseudonocardia eucalypti]|uniref:hypothetical protein n=1 Tax=Pseudonocardia eucalypti TaxID=648755 RepID=UPI0018054571|nr:tryptophan 2,3-dioxygenase [Pseudonocardia eucalypti]
MLSGTADPAGFPLLAVASEVLKSGKHFLDPESLEALRRARLTVTASAHSARRSLVLNFLDVVLDKADGRYDYLTYTAQPLFPIVTDDSPDRRRDRTVALLLADLLTFELTELAGELDVLPEMRPSPELVAKRLRLALRAARPAAQRVGVTDDLDGTDTGPDPAREFAAAVMATGTAAERDLLCLTMQPVATLHDEYLFLRVLQAFEATFAAQAQRLRATITALDAGDPLAAARLLERNSEELREAGTIFSLIATMQVEAFRTFRAFTEGASAIQSESYKAMESLCRQPNPDRLAGLPYTSVPKVREAVLAGQPTVWEAVMAAEGRIGADDARVLAEAMSEYEAVMRRWRRTHHSIAVRMLGDTAGTGYTVGTPYLRSAMDLPVFDMVDPRRGITPNGGSAATR